MIGIFMVLAVIFGYVGLLSPIAYRSKCARISRWIALVCYLVALFFLIIRE